MPRKRFGQHFLVDAVVVDGILDIVRPQPGVRIVEIGPGGGVLTERLIAAGAEVLAIEIDRDLAAALARRFAEAANFTVHCADVLKFDLGCVPGRGERWKVVGNLPYNISTPLIMRLVEHADRFSELVLMVQREVADRLVAEPGSKSYGRLGIMAQHRARISRRLDVGPDAFAPPPKVDSAVIHLAPRPGPFDAAVEAALARVVRTAFNARRKTLANALRGVADAALLERCGIAAGARPEELSVDDYVRLASALQHT